MVVGVDSMEEHSMHDLQSNYSDDYMNNTASAVSMDPIGKENETKLSSLYKYFYTIHFSKVNKY